AVGQGQSAVDVLDARKSVTEGVYTARAMVALADTHGIDAPIARTVHDIVDNGLAVDDALTALMSRPMKSED
ncbi:MAG: glycerol-3-phosphate dehydrogenase, partial [Pseudomonadota bacterium]